MYNRTLIILICTLFLISNNLLAAPFDGNKALLKRVAPWLAKHGIIMPINAFKDIF